MKAHAPVVRCRTVYDINIAIAEFIFADPWRVTVLLFKLQQGKQTVCSFEIDQLRASYLSHSAGSLLPTHLTVETALYRPLLRRHQQIELVRRSLRQLELKGISVCLCDRAFRCSGFQFVDRSLAAERRCVLAEDFVC